MSSSISHDMEWHGAKKAKWISGLSLLSILLYLSGFFVWLTPLPVLYGYKKGGRSLGLIILGSTLVGVFLLYQGVDVLAAGRSAEEASKIFFWLPGFGTGGMKGWSLISYGLFYFVCYGMTGALLGEWEPIDGNLTRLVGRSVTFVCAAIVLWVFIFTPGGLRGSVATVEGYFLDLLNQMKSVSEDNSEVRQQLAVLDSYRDTIVYYAVRLMPAIIVNTLVFVTWLNIFVSKKLFFKENMFPRLGPFKNWGLPFFSVWVLISAAFFLLLDIYWLHAGFFKLLALNSFLVFGLAYFFQGLAIAAYFGDKWRLSPLVKLVFYVLLILFIQPVAFILIAFGFFDSWFDFRKLAPKAAGS